MPRTETSALLAWYDHNHRDLPWRISPAMRAKGHSADPYKVWLSEVMLQQTTVKTVRSYFLDFVKRWPTVSDLASAETEDVMKAWAGLGYYARARNLKRCADVVASEHHGIFPDTEDGLRTLPGIGDYTSAAIAAIAFNQRSAVVDGNVERVITRLFAISTPLPSAKAEIRAKVEALTPADRPGDFAQGMMDLGATICTPKNPACGLCPLNASCLALKSHDPEDFPVKPPKKKKPLRRGAAFVAENERGAILLRKRITRGLLGGMSEVPGTDWTSRVDGDTSVASAPFAADWRQCGEIVHVFTHFELHLTVYHAQGPMPRVNDGWWEPRETLGEQALPTVMKKAISAAIPRAFDPRIRTNP
jgi:A/G-specific adenine glycosylase